MSEVYVEGKRYRLDPSMSIGKGGEADVYSIDPRTVVKIYKQPDHPDLAGDQGEMEAARRRLEEQQTKLREFPKILGTRHVVSPLSLATDRTGSRILGYTMEFVPQAEVLLRWSERSFRGASIDNNQVAGTFTHLHKIVSELHRTHFVVIGDFNDLNVLVDFAGEPWLIDCDSFQFGKYLTRVYTERFVDPLLCDPKETRPVLVKPYKPLSDWYAYAVMLFRSLALTDPFGGVYKPKARAMEVPHAARPLRRISVFNKDVRYPKPAVPLDRLPDGMLGWFEKTFQEDLREEFPRRLLDTFRWTKCTDCGTDHARPSCPVCQKAAPAAVKEAIRVRGKVTATRIFRTSGEIVYATWQGNELRYVTVEREALYNYRRENREIALESRDPVKYRWRVSGAKTLFGSNERLGTWDPKERVLSETYVDSFRTVPSFDANERHSYWVDQGVLYRDGDLGAERIGDVLQGQTLFWVGPAFGFGFYRAGELSVAFVFDAERKGLNDTVRIPRMTGHLVDCTTVFGKGRAWFLSSLKEGPKIVNRCLSILENGTVDGTAEAEQGDGSWLSGIRGKCAMGPYLFAVTDEGVVRLEVQSGKILKTAEFPDTEPFVHSGCHLVPGNGLYVVDRSEIIHLKIA